MSFEYAMLEAKIETTLSSYQDGFRSCLDSGSSSKLQERCVQRAEAANSLPPEPGHRGIHQRAASGDLESNITAKNNAEIPKKAASVCSLRLKKMDGKKLRNLIFNIRRGMMAKLKDESNPK